MSWTFQGSLDGTSWTTLDIQSGINSWDPTEISYDTKHFAIIQTTTAGPPTTSTTSSPPTAAKFLLMVEGFHGSPYDALSDAAKNQKAVIVDHVDYVLNRLKNGERR